MDQVKEKQKEISVDTYNDIIFEVERGRARVLLNRPKALNALSFEMAKRFDARLSEWAEDPAVRFVVIEGAGERAFCAGGDIRELYRSMNDPASTLAADFYRVEYRLNHRIHAFPKPYVALIDGVVMGGGVGVSVHGSHRVVGDKLLFAMPETGIGLFPDVGGSYFLPRLPGRLGFYLGLTGARIGAADALYCGIATHYVPSDRFAALRTALDEGGAEGIDAAIARFAADPGPAPLAAHRAAIDRCFAAGTVEGVLDALRAEGTEWARETLAGLAKKSPTSLKVTLRQLQRGAGLDFAAAMRMEYRLSQHFCAGHDFREGIRAVVIDKDNAPRWRPDRLDAVSEADVESYFAPLPGGDLEL